MHLRLALLAVVLVCSSCATKTTSSVSGESSDGFALHTKFVEFTFWPAAAESATNARTHFIKTCKEEAQKRHHEVAAIALIDASVKRHDVSGFNDIELDGRVRYGKEPFAGPTIVDNSLLFQRAAQSQEKSDRLNGMLAGAAAGMSQASRDFNQITNQGIRSIQSQQLNSNLINQNMQLNNINSSIQNNTRAINQLNTTIYAP
jgi:hypothetical protein